jgi:hypothetical protein
MPDGTFAFPPGTQEAWSKLAQQLPASTGPFAGPTSPQDGGKQWMRAISRVVYQTTGKGGPDQDFGGGQDKPAQQRLFQPAPFDTPPSTTLDDVSVTAPAPKEPDSGGEGLELSALRVSFNVHSNTATTPAALEARIYNLSPDTMKKVVQFGRVKLMAGYKYAQYGVIFDGKVVQYRRGKENPTDTYLEINAFDGDDLSKSITRRRYEAGTKESHILNDLIRDTGMPAGDVSPAVGTQILVRPWIMAGMTQKYIRDLMLKYNANCYPELGKLHVVPQREYRKSEIVVLSPRTGLVGIPEATPEGIQIRCLLNPKLRLGGLVQLDNKLISGVAFIPGSGEINESTYYSGQFSDAVYHKIPVPQPTSPIGQYKIYAIEYSGDNRGQPWYCDLICLGLNTAGKPIETAGSVFLRLPDEAR